MKRIISIAIMLSLSVTLWGQSIESTKVVIINDSIMAMGIINGRMQTVIPAPQEGKSIIVQSIDVRNKVNQRLYSPDASGALYKIGYQQGSYWYDVAEINFEELNSKGNTTIFTSATVMNRLFEETQTNAAPLMIKFDRPMNFTTGSNRLTLYVTYRILN